jgi:hypothetical protein
LKTLITGPSCSGKTTLGRSLIGCRLVELDRLDGAAFEEGNGGDCMLEGIPSGSEEEIRRLLASMDQILWLQVPFGMRLHRMIERDGPAALGRFLYNEFAWNRYLAPLLEGNRKVRRLS